MRIETYCSSKHGNGFMVGLLGESGISVLAVNEQHSGRYMSIGGVDLIFQRTNGNLMLVLNQVEAPRGKTVTDRTNSEIRISISFIAEKLEEENKLSALLHLYLSDAKKVCSCLYKAYNPDAGNKVGYDFDKVKINEMLNEATDSFVPQYGSNSYFKSKGYYKLLSDRDADRVICTMSLPEDDGLYLVRTSLHDSKKFEQSFPSSQKPVCLVSTNPDSFIVVIQPPPLQPWERIIDFIKKNAKTSRLAFLGLVLAVVFICIIASQKDNSDSSVVSAVSVSPAVTVSATETASPTSAPTVESGGHEIEDLTVKRVHILGDAVSLTFNAELIKPDWLARVSVYCKGEKVDSKTGLYSELCRYEFTPECAGMFSVVIEAHPNDRSDAVLFSFEDCFYIVEPIELQYTEPELYLDAASDCSQVQNCV